MSLSNKIDFAVVFQVRNANPNGDPLNGNRPRVTYEGLGEVSDVCLKRKMRDRLQEMKHPIFVQSDDRKTDGYASLRDRYEGEIKSKGKKNDELIAEVTQKWFDVRAFGHVLALKGAGAKAGDGVSIPIRGPVTVQTAFSVSPVSVTSTQITKSVSGETTATGKRSSDTMGMKHRVDKGIYCFYGSISPQLAIKTKFSDTDADILKGILPRLFENDASSARPDGSMRVLKVFWWKHNCPTGQYSSAKVHGSLKPIDNEVTPYELTELSKLKPEIIDGF